MYGDMIEQRRDRQELHGIQILRGLAALAVVIHHMLEHSNGAAGRFSPDWLTTAGASGVDIFFVISGFIMLRVSFRGDGAAIGPRDFLIRRAVRIYPFYWLCCMAMLLLIVMGFLSSHHPDAATIFGSLLLLPGGQLIGVAWTLVYEIYFYLLFAMLLHFGSEKAAAIGTTAAIALAWPLSTALPAGALAAFLASPLPIEFCFGLGLAFALRRIRDWPFALPAAILGAALLILAPMIVAHPDTNGLPPLPRVIVWGIPAALVVAGVLTVGAPRNAFARLLVLLGDASYALYLTHTFVMIGYGRLIKIAAFSRLSQPPMVAIATLVAVTIGIAAHLLVEKRLLAWTRRITHRRVALGRPDGQPVQAN